MSRKIWSRRSSISPEFVDCSVLIYNGKTPVRCKITEGKVGHKFGEFALHGDEDPIEQIEERAERGKSKV
ncbi:hypothetical protein PVAP13_J683318 [Panicum virgatum]|nr:hypothetical protein PVAP13_J683318 [Panicum virgatum]